jgi:hypothetical protein
MYIDVWMMVYKPGEFLYLTAAEGGKQQQRPAYNAILGRRQCSSACRHINE